METFKCKSNPLMLGIKKLFRLYNNHLFVYLNQFDPIKEFYINNNNNNNNFHHHHSNREKFSQTKISFSNSTQKINKPTKHYLFALLAIWYFIIECLNIIVKHYYYYYYYSNSSFSSYLNQTITTTNHNNFWQLIVQSEYLWTHRIFPQKFWYQGDILSVICVLMAVVMYTLLLTTKILNPKCFMLLLIGNDYHGRSLSSSSSSSSNVILMATISYRNNYNNHHRSSRMLQESSMMMVIYKGEEARMMAIFRHKARRLAIVLLNLILFSLETYFLQQLLFQYYLHQQQQSLIYDLVLYLFIMPCMVNYSALGK